MSRSLLISPFAELDLYDIKSWYTAEENNIYKAFILEFEALLKSITANPEKFPKIYKHYRKALLKRFPYKIIFIESVDYIRIEAIIHHKRGPKVLKSRFR